MNPDKLRARLLECLGDPWPEPCSLAPQLRETIPGDGYRIESITCAVEPEDRVPAFLLVPDSVDADHPAPAANDYYPKIGFEHNPRAWVKKRP